MGNGIYSALSGALADAQRMEVISHNVANVSTPNFRQFRMALMSADGAAKSDELSFAVPSKVQVDSQAGPLRATDSPLDIALSNNVFIEVRENDKPAFVRGGTLVLKPDGSLVDDRGHQLMGAEQPIKLPPDTKSIVVLPDGTVEADGNSFDQLRLIEFDDPQALTPGTGRLVYDSGAAGPRPAETPSPVLSGYIEQSNIGVVRGITDLIAAHRHYDVALRAIETFKQVDKRAATELRV